MRIVDLTVHVPAMMAKTSLDDLTIPKERWKTFEFRIYTVLACIVLPIMAWIPISLSLPSNSNYPLYQHRLSPGWIPFRKVDNSDAQYRSFRSNLLTLTAIANLYFFLKFIWNAAVNASPSNRIRHLRYNLLFSLLLILALHGSSALKILAILSINFTIAKLCKTSRLSPVLTWVFNGVVLYSNEKYDGYLFGNIVPALQWLDAYKGFYPRWHIGFNITMLRLVSFNMDYYWACHTTVPFVGQSNMAAKERLSGHPKDMYSFLAYLSYILYPPLYIAGPILTFNDYLWQHQHPLHIPGRSVLLYFLRFLGCLLTMELILHFMYVVAIKDTKAWIGYTPAQIAMVGFWNLMIVWLKLLIPWRFFRLWALMDGIDPPENMVRCMANNYSTLGFWRSWHRSYNIWIIRYIYIPLGGRRNLIPNAVLIFSFVALWHDLTFRLLAWGWLVALFIVPEVAAMHLLPAYKFGTKVWYRHVCAFGATLNILMMMAANLVGFVIGTDGLRYFTGQLFGTWEGLRFLLLAVGCLFVGAQLMFEYREEEKRKGIARRC